MNEQYCGPITCLIALFVFPFVCCCPCDRKQEFYAIQGGAPEVAVAVATSGGGGGGGGSSAALA